MLWKYRKVHPSQSHCSPRMKPVFITGCYKTVALQFTKCPQHFQQLERKMTSWLEYELKNTHTIENRTSDLSLDLAFSPSWVQCVDYFVIHCFVTSESILVPCQSFTAPKLVIHVPLPPLQAPVPAPQLMLMIHSSLALLFKIKVSSFAN